MKRFLSLIFLFSVHFSVFAESFVYFQNNTSLNLNLSTSSTLGSSYWVESFTGNVEAWKLKTKIYEVNRNVGITNGTDFFLTTTISSGTDSVKLKIKLRGKFSGSDIWHSASGNVFNHPWRSNYSFYSEEFVLQGDTFILTYRSDLPPSSVWADFYYVLQEKHPYNIDIQELADSNVLNILSYNVFMLTPPIGSSEEYTRAGILHKYVKNYDALIISEAFYNAARIDLLIPLLSPEYPYHTAVVVGSAIEDGGVMIFSRWPIEFEQQYLYTDCDGTDCLSSKGAMYARINKLGKKYHLFGTHTQAWPDAASVAVRLGQLAELHQFIGNQNISSSEAVIIGGDLNVDKANTNQNLEYLPMLTALNANEPTYIGLPYSYDPNYNAYAASGPREYLDYVFVEKDYLCATEYTNEVKILRHVEQIDDLWDNNSLDLDLSDHFPVHGRFVFPEVNIFAQKDSLCSGENLLLYVNSNVNLNFQWYRNDTLIVGAQNDTLNVLAKNATYYCKASNAICTDIYTKSKNIFVFPKVNAPVLTRTNNLILAASNIGIQWYFNGVLLQGETNSFVNTCTPGNYYSTFKLGECTSLPSNIITIENATPTISLYGNVAVSSSAEGNQWYNSAGEILNATNDTLIICEDDSYFVIATINGCTTDTTNTITYQNIFTNPTIYWSADTIYASQSAGNLWYLDGVLMPNETLNYIIPQNDGIYSNAISTDCGLRFSNEIQAKNTSIYTILEQDVFVYPNPIFGNIINIVLTDMPGNSFNMKLIDIRGKQVYTRNLQSKNTQNIELPFGLNGIFYVIIESENYERIIQKISIIN